MNKTCARCEKTVYPTEELKCLDKVWHKGCFKCQECGMTLNMRTYKGYGKLPYCEAHVPKAKHTTMAETPELKRIAENTKIQSNVKYHADFEKSKGKFTQVADDPETLRIKANTKIISNVAYHGELEKKAQMEKQRQINENGEIVDVPSDNYHQQIDNYATEMLPPNSPPPNLPPKNHYQTPSTQYQPPVQPTQTQPKQNRQYQEQQYQDYQSQYYPQYQEYQYQQQYQNYPPPPQQQTQQQKIGRIQDYDPISDGPRAPPNTQRASATLIYNSTNDGKRGAHQQSGHQHQQTRQIGRVTDLDPLANEMPRPPTNHHNQRVYVAMYDYEASDSDEVSFREGDLISNVTSIDSGWMTGQVLRTGRTGMLPANYVELTTPNAGPHYDN
ncbi:LIM zinc-binding domain-containing Nebulette isoform X1 [Spodoptera frugiperda]|uniref:LIM zinc-binding domain-containing Nebulette isoform X1 n=1 Tax=Spodoptera frugiperda TaxID=7108 RepID=A0A9R0E569_SPOFR|nr:LIM zinc-binding domain-containing Nebulette isoform X1 [Spodoptera frugiperda]